MTEQSAALRATSEALLRDLEILGALEEEKRTLALDDPRVNDLATRIEAIAERVLAASSYQRALVDEGEGAPIEAQPRPTAAILAEWRDAERLRTEAAPGSADAIEAEMRIRRARAEYQRAFAATRERGDDPSGTSGA